MGITPSSVGKRTSAAEAAITFERRETRNRWLLSAPALTVLAVAALGPLFIVLV